LVLYNVIVHQTGHLYRVTSLQVCLISEKHTYLMTFVCYQMIRTRQHMEQSRYIAYTER